MPRKKVATQPDSPLAIISMVLGVTSLMGPGLLLGLPAIVLAIIALRRNAGGKNLSIAGLVTGAISTILSLLFIAFVIFLIQWSGDHPEEFYEYEQQQEQTLESTQT